MGNINLSFKINKNQNKSKDKREKVILTYHEVVPYSEEYYTFINKDYKEEVLLDKSYSITKVSASKFVGKKTSVSKVSLNYIPSKEAIKYKPAYFTYNGEKISLTNNPIFNEETNSYIGKLVSTKIYDKEIKLYEE